MGKVFSTTMTNIGGRTGEVHSPDGSFSFKTDQPGAPGAEAGATNPEQLFAAGYSSCFNSALALVLLRAHIKTVSTVSATVSLYEGEGQNFYIGVEIEGHIDGVPPEQAQAYLEQAHQVCPYSKATRGNIEVTIKAV